MVDNFIKTKAATWQDDVAFLDAMGNVTKAEVLAFANQFLKTIITQLFIKEREKIKALQK